MRPLSNLLPVQPQGPEQFFVNQNGSVESHRSVADFGVPGECYLADDGDVQRQLMNVYVDYHRPTWWLAWNVELMVRNESPMSFPTMSAEIFAARAMILREPAEQLERYLDLPWCKADLFYIQKIVMCLEAGSRVDIKDVRH